MTVTFAKPNLVKINDTELSDHNRSALAIAPEELKVEHRTVNGTMRKYSIGWKQHFSFSWEFLPNADEKTVDGKAGRDTIKALVQGTTSTVTFLYRNPDGSTNTYTCFIENYSEELTKRWDSDFWTVSLGLVEQ
jgi:hypothetical protein